MAQLILIFIFAFCAFKAAFWILEKIDEIRRGPRRRG